jgi:hypothetical protein
MRICNVEFLAEYFPSDLHDLDHLCRAAELADLTPIIKIDQAACEYVAPRAIGAGFQGVLFTDCRSADEARHYVRLVRPETPQDGGLFGAAPRRFTPRPQVGGAEYLQALREVVVMLMIEKREAVEHLEEILAVPGIDMIQWGPRDYTVSIGKPGARFDPETNGERGGKELRSRQRARTEPSGTRRTTARTPGTPARQWRSPCSGRSVGRGVSQPTPGMSARCSPDWPRPSRPYAATSNASAIASRIFTRAEARSDIVGPFSDA